MWRCDVARPGPLLRLVVVPLVAVAVALSVGAWASGRTTDSRPPLVSAFGSLPAGTLVAGFTDWASIRRDLGLGDASTAAGRSALTDDASLRDLTTRSVIGGLVADMHATYGWSAADLDWEAYGRAPAGAAMVARFSGSVSIDTVERRLGTLGYVRRDGVWSLPAGGSGTQVGPELAATLANIAIDPGRRLVVATDSPAFASTVLATIRGSRASVLTERALVDAATPLVGSDSVVVQAAAFGCRATSMSSGGADVQAQADAAVARGGGPLATPTFTGRGLVDGSRRQTIRFTSAFDSPARATDQSRVRAALATGPFIGRSGRIEDSLVLRSAVASGTVSTLTFALDPDRGAYMSGEGPLLFAACPS